MPWAVSEVEADKDKTMPRELHKDVSIPSVLHEDKPIPGVLQGKRPFLRGCRMCRRKDRGSKRRNKKEGAHLW